jgi:elongation factor Ts
VTEITAALIRALRERTGAGVMACKAALQEAGGDILAAAALVRARGAESADQRADRPAREGLVALFVDAGRGALVELNCQTDFVARHSGFQSAAACYAQTAVAVGGDRDALFAAPAPDGDGAVADHIARLSAVTGETIVLRRIGVLRAGRGVLAGYAHASRTPGLGAIGALVALEGELAPEALAALGRGLAMHIAAAAPLAVRIEDLSSDLVAGRRAAFTADAEASGKPAPVVARMIEGRMRKFHEASALLAQRYVLDADVNIAAVLRAAGGGAPVAVTGFLRFKCGEDADAALVR